jgi:hypothetical protein
MKTIFKYISETIFIFLAAGLLLGSCTKNFDEINTNPDKSTSTSAAALATSMIASITSSDISGTKTFMQPFMMDKSILWTEQQEGSQYNKIGRTDFDRLEVLRNVPVMLDYAADLTDGTQPSYEALGHFIRAWEFFYTTMTVGDIPYSEAIKGESDGVIKPKYDSQKEVFAGILNELDSANMLFGKGANFEGDFIYDGDVSKWQKLTNSFELYVLIQLYKHTDDPDLKVKERFKTIATTRNLMSSINDNFAVTYQNAGGLCYPWSNTPVQVNSFVIYPVIGRNLIEPLKTTKDRRLFYFAEPAAAKIAGGLGADDYNAYVGVEASDPINQVKLAHDNDLFCDVNNRYVDLFNAEPVGLFNYWQLQFVLAEGAVRGWLPASDAETYFENGIRANMNFLKANTGDKYTHGMPITDEYITSFLSTVKLTGTTEQQIEQIITQEYIAGFMQDANNNGWFENRRTGYPVFKLNTATNQNQPNTGFPKRWLYPQNELDHNAENVAAAIQSQFGGNDNVNNLMWILK